ncbi:MAG: Holliday junction resolvase RuvX [Bacteroidaceae bacterium]|nr:Holliday junction resolvase RuvX [Bacteroidaceae bacterium]
MSRIMSIDYGAKRTGIAVSDPLQMIANGLTTVATAQLHDFIKNYLEKEDVECIVIGLPKQTNGADSENMKRITPFVNRLRKLYPHIKIEYYDERFTSVLAHQTMLDSGIGRKSRQDKALVDKISATIILQDYMESMRFRGL